MFLFRGQRKYVQGADIVNYIERLIPSKKKFEKLDIIFKKFILSQPKIILIKQNKNSSYSPKKFDVLCTIKYKNSKRMIKFINSKIKINNNYSYDEKMFYKYFYPSKKKSVNCKLITDYSDIEILVALTKYWHLRNIKKKGNWIFNRLKLNKPFLNKNKKDIKIINVYNKYNKYTVSEIFQNKINIGEIHFSIK